MTEIIVPQQASIYMVSTTIIRVVVMLFGLLLVVRTAPLKRISKTVGFVVVAAALLAWTPLLVVLGRNNTFQIDGAITFPPPIVVGAVMPVIIGYVAFQYWDTWQQIVFNIPQQWLIGIQGFRLTGGMILVLYWRGLLPAEFAIPVGAGDVLVGATAILVAYFYYKRKPWSKRTALWWNYIGLAEIIMAIPLGILTSPSPIQQLALDSPNFLSTTYPIVLFPTFSVPVGILLHLYSLALLKQDGRPVRKTDSQKFSWGILLFFAIVATLYAIVFYFIVPVVTSRPLGFQIHEELQKTFAAHSIGLYFHIVPSILAMILGPFQFHRGLRNKHRNLHRWLGRFYLFGILFGGLGGFYMALFSFAGPVAQLGFGILAIAWLFTGYKAYTDIRQGRVDTHREWMIRNYALTFAAVTLRIYTRSFIGLGYLAPDFHHINAWLCWAPNLIVAEWIIRRTRARRRVEIQGIMPRVES